MDRLDEIRSLLPERLRQNIFNGGFGGGLNVKISYDELEELRLRCGQPVAVQLCGREYISDRIIVTPQELKQTLSYMSNYSLYAKQEDIRQGYLTVKGGHRVGVFGKTVVEQGRVVNQSHLSFLNIRVAHQIKGCADSVMKFVHKDGQLRHTLIVSPPGCGKTTLLRDMIRQISNGGKFAGKKVSVIDERSEIAGCLEGIPQNDMGLRTDVLDACPKAEGMMMAIRAMSPQVIAVDEIGSKADAAAIRYCINCGCIILGTVHGLDLEELMSKPTIKELLGKGCFERLIFLSGSGKNRQISCQEIVSLKEN